MSKVQILYRNFDRCLIQILLVSKEMIQQHLSRIVQSIIALPLLILTISHWNDNQIGQNLINLSATATYVIGLDYIIIVYRWFMNHQESFHYQLTIIFGMLFLIGKLFEKFHPSENEIPFNAICEYNLIGIITINFAFVVFLLLILIIYSIRQIYRLMTETLLSTNQNLEQFQRNTIMNMKVNFSTIKASYPSVNLTCSICLMQFQPENPSIMLPGCQHCFHHQCIQGWIQNHSTCPYCRNNLRLSLI